MAINIECPVCGNTSGKKVSAIVAAGTSSGTGSGSVYVNDEWHNVTTNVNTKTSLAVDLSPPPEPNSAVLSCIGTIGIIFSALTGIVSFMFLNSEDTGFAIGMMLFCWGLGAVLALLIRVGNAKVGKQLPLWERAMECWDQLYYCDQSDTVFNSVTNEHFPRSRWAMENYLESKSGFKLK